MFDRIKASPNNYGIWRLYLFLLLELDDNFSNLICKCTVFLVSIIFCFCINIWQLHGDHSKSLRRIRQARCFTNKLYLTVIKKNSQRVIFRISIIQLVCPQNTILLMNCLRENALKKILMLIFYANKILSSLLDTVTTFL